MVDVMEGYVCWYDVGLDLGVVVVRDLWIGEDFGIYSDDGFYEMRLCVEVEFYDVWFF